jgi:hypothetical protein
MYLTIDYDENMRRGTRDDRTSGGRTKAATLEVLKEIRGRGEPYVFPDVEGIHLDVTSLEVEEAASRLLGEIEGWCARRVEG